MKAEAFKVVWKLLYKYDAGGLDKVILAQNLYLQFCSKFEISQRIVYSIFPK